MHSEVNRLSVGWAVGGAWCMRDKAFICMLGCVRGRCRVVTHAVGTANRLLACAGGEVSVEQCLPASEVVIVKYTDR